MINIYFEENEIVLPILLCQDKKEEKVVCND
jgi:hypothetical protein